ncbi:hypothetical protein BGX38DRAFT_1268845 [Terfezia claveryi]|nr:hypothetical protein BGX38DRAFT_1268845 [Terfezia claveryi]
MFQVPLDSKAWESGSRITYQQMLQLDPLELGWVDSVRRLSPTTMQGRIMSLYVDGEIWGGEDRVSRAVLLRLFLDVLDDFQDISVDLEKEKFNWSLLQSLREEDAKKVKRQCQDLTTLLEAEKAKVKVLEARVKSHSYDRM